MNSIIWDFDGVIVDSNHIRENGFRHIFSRYSEQQISNLLEYHNNTGGVSRLIKIKYFYHNILRLQLSSKDLQQYGDRFKRYMLTHLKDKSIIIDEIVEFVASTQSEYSHYICSGSDGSELREICQHLGLANYFKAIEGSPPSKQKLLYEMLKNYSLDSKKCIYVGDSIIDMEASEACGVRFVGYNNVQLRGQSCHYASSVFDIDHFITCRQ